MNRLPLAVKKSQLSKEVSNLNGLLPEDRVRTLILFDNANFFYQATVIYGQRKNQENKYINVNYELFIEILFRSFYLTSSQTQIFFAYNKAFSQVPEHIAKLSKRYFIQFVCPVFSLEKGNKKDDKAIIDVLKSCPKHYPNLKEIILISGDGDYCAHLKNIVSKKIKIYIVAFDESINWQYYHDPDFIVDTIEDLLMVEDEDERGIFFESQKIQKSQRKKRNKRKGRQERELKKMQRLSKLFKKINS